MQTISRICLNGLPASGPGTPEIEPGLSVETLRADNERVTPICSKIQPHSFVLAAPEEHVPRSQLWAAGPAGRIDPEARVPSGCQFYKEAIHD